MKVYADIDGEKILIGRADVTEDVGRIYEVDLFGPASIICEKFTIGTVTHTPAAGPLTERAVLLSPGQRPELLPGWTPLAS